MKKFSRYILAFLFSLLVAFVSFPFPDTEAAVSWDNIIYSIKANLGMVSVVNGSLSALDNTDFYLSLYETPLVQDGVSFVPAQTFSSKGEWVDTCQNRGNPNVVGFTDFDIVQSLQDSGYIQKSSSGYDFSNLPKLGENFQNSQSPLDGVEVITNFSDYNNGFSTLALPSYSENLVNTLKNSYISNFSNVYIFSGVQTFTTKPYQYMYRFYSFPNNAYSFFIVSKNSYNEYGILYYFIDSNNQWQSGYDCSNLYLPYCTSTSTDTVRYAMNSSLNLLSDYRGLVGNSQTNVEGTNNLSVRFSPNVIPDYWGNFPLVLASTESVGKNYYYWLKGSPSGLIYTMANTGNVYTTEYIENNDWSQIYNNYITDVSNYYSTTENITNEQLSQYIDNSTTITNITNNYITNNNGGGEDDIITNSWLERIYEKLVEIKSILLGQPLDSGDSYYTDNSIRNEIVEYPVSDLFPDVPVEDLFDTSEDFTIDLFASKVSLIASEVIPFCYIKILKDIALSLAAPPSAPYFEIPFQIDRINIDESIVIDLTGEEWVPIHNIWLTLFMIIFVAYLFYLTYKVVLLVSNLLA